MSSTTKSVYLKDSLLEEMQRGVQDFNLSKRISDLVELGLLTEKSIRNSESSLIELNNASIGELLELLELGYKYKNGLLDVKVTMKSAIEYLVKGYNKRNAENPIVV